MSWSIVIPTVGRPSLSALLASLNACRGPLPRQVVLVDDRAVPAQPLPVGRGWTADRLLIRSSCGHGPAAARNAGWRAADPQTDWIAFLDDDVTVSPSWLTDLQTDLSAADQSVAASQGRIVVALPTDRRPTDWERSTAGLSAARWVTADMAYRRDVLSDLGGFDERFRRAYREDTDLALRAMNRGLRLVRGGRTTYHPVRPSQWSASIHQQLGNADDALMWRVHGTGWHRRAGCAVGRRPTHLVTTGSATFALGAALFRRPRAAKWGAAAWLGLTAQFAWHRIAPGPRTPGEVATMMMTSVLIPPAASWHWLRGCWLHREATTRTPHLRAVLLDRDGTLIKDVPYNGDPCKVEPLPRVAAALNRLRNHGIRLAVVSNQSGVARGLLTLSQVRAVNERVDKLLGPFDNWQVCPHSADDGCTCRKPRPGLIRAAAAALGVTPQQCAMVGDIGADIDAARAAGAGLAVLVPTASTKPEEIGRVPNVCSNIEDAVDLILGRIRR